MYACMYVLEWAQSHDKIVVKATLQKVYSKIKI